MVKIDKIDNLCHDEESQNISLYSEKNKHQYANSDVEIFIDETFEENFQDI